MRQGQRDLLKNDTFILGLLIFFLGVSISYLAFGLERVFFNNEGAPSLKGGMKTIYMVCSPNLYEDTCIRSLCSFTTPLLNFSHEGFTSYNEGFKMDL